ncbi:CRISPR-associated helicase Cas3' [Chelativorans xinjiangense]|uniref:CRISPR-associated helicase Cas3' n=1 Tax=Chelativorans xinjiangense TaxID=2681485 RepID=UPI00135CAD3E|nr:CRISPR-associated helicase Cas3' [Chelativorans xinjiangense]
MFFAHSTEDTSCSDWQLLHRHLIDVAELAAQFAVVFGAERATRLAGLLHDLGKYTPAFQARLTGALEKVDHSTAGAAETFTLVSAIADRAMAELIAYAIAGHHAGLPDRIGDGSLAERLKKQLEPLDPSWRDEIAPDAVGLMPDFEWSKDKDKAAFQLGFLGRMIFSCLVDADFRDTEAFYDGVKGEKKDREWPALGTIIDPLIACFEVHIADKQSGGTASKVNQLRGEILAHVRAKASEATGLFTLTVPTGGGKTLASLGFALDHAKKNGLERIIFAIPFTSVIDQTASVFREVLGDEFILEHHSAIDFNSAAKENEFREKFEGNSLEAKLRLAMEDWAAPIVVTTNVQLFESLFANRPSRCRKLHNLARSIIILDEAQTIPLPLLRPCVAALDELARNYGISIVLCTATQPALAAPEFEGGLVLGSKQELAPDPPGLARALKRVEIASGGEMSDDDLVAALRDNGQGLVIVNSRKHALALYKAAKAAGLDGVVHLTTRQYATHRREILADVRHRLKKKLPCRLIATSLVEAGVDVDFPRVWRAEAGLDQIAQAAGRCNREGERPVGESIVTIFKAPENPPPREIGQLAADFVRMADKHQDLLSPDAMRDYFGEVYWRKGDRLDAKKILEDFRLNRDETNFAYRCVAEKFRMIESGMVPVIVARDEAARDALGELAWEKAYPGAVARKLQSFIVQVPPKARNLLIANRHVRFEQEKRFGDQFAVLVTGSFYKPEIGLIWEDADYLGLEQPAI